MIVLFVVGTVSLAFGILPKYSKVERNSLIGYRTYLSLKNDQNWEFANRLFSSHAIIIGVILLVVGYLNVIVRIQIEYILFIILSLLLASIVTIEAKLKKFDESQR